MSTVRTLHDEAMKLSQLALVARETGDQERAVELAYQAYEFEAQAAALVPDEKASEPTRSILYRSAASLAYQSKQYSLAQQLVAKGLSGYPSPKVEQELKVLYEKVNFELNLQAHGIVMSDEEVRMTLKGSAVGFGDILYNEFIKRVEAIFSLVDRTVQRKMGAPYRKSGRTPQVYRPFTRVLSAFESGSFVVTVRLGVPDGQQLSLLFDTSEVISEMLTGIEFVNNSYEDRLRQLIPSEEYYLNFIGLARELAPDGEQVKSVAFTNHAQNVSLVRPRKEISLTTKPHLINDDQEQKPMIKVAGILDYASSRKGDAIGLTSEDGVEYDIVIREGFDDIVRSYFKKSVVVTGSIDGKRIEPTDLEFADGL